jgi:ribosomal protein S15P/S13E
MISEILAAKLMDDDSYSSSN